MNSKHCTGVPTLAGKNYINLGLLAANLAAGWVFMTADDPGTAVAALGAHLPSFTLLTVSSPF